MQTIRTLAVSALFVPALAAQQARWPESMDFGPVLMTTFEGGGACGTVDKGLLVRLGERGTVAFDTELLRLSAAWVDGWLRLRGTAYDGSHGPMPKRRGQTLVETRPGPGWARAGSFVDPRPIPHGPLPRDWGQYLGHSRSGDDVVVEYRVGAMTVREGYAMPVGDVPTLLRTLELSPATEAHRMVVLDAPEGASAAVAAADARAAVLRWQPKASGLVEIDSTTAGWESLSIGGPSAEDYLDPRAGSGATISFVPGFAPAHGAPADASGDALLLPRLSDGVGATNSDDWSGSVWFDKHQVHGKESDDGRLHVDLRRLVEVSRVDSFSWHDGYRSVQQYVLYGSTAESPDLTAVDPEKAGWTRIAAVDTGELGYGDKHAAGVWRDGGLGAFRHLLFDVQSGSAFFSEIDVFTGDREARIDAVGRPRRSVVAALRGDAGPALRIDGTRIVMDVPAHAEPLRVQIALAATGDDGLTALLPRLQAAATVAPLATGPATPRWSEAVVTKGQRGVDDGPFAVDTITIPFENPYGSRMRTGAFDFFSDGRAAVSTWNGDVWIVSGIDDDLDQLEWRRFATGLFDPLGLRIVDDVVFVHGRDGLTRLIDANGDGETDRYECFNNQVYITPAFHEFAFDLQTDAAGNFYFSKGAPVNPGGRGFMTIVPHHGTILKVAKDGGSIEAIATGLRAPNGIGVSPDGVVTSGDNEGTFMPRCRLNWIEQPGFYGGVKATAHRTSVPDEPDLPLCWFPMEVDNSSGGQVWVSRAGWPDLQGRLLHLSYGTCSVYLVLPERVDGRMQGGVVRLPANFSSSCMRGRFSPIDGQLYVVGLQGWQTSAAREGGFHRVRRTQRPLDLPIALHTCDKGVYLTFSTELDPETAADPESYGVEVWNYRYSPNYGSPEVSVLEPERQAEQGKPNRDPLTVGSARLSEDRRTVFLAVDGMQPVNQMRITWDMDSADGRLLRGELHNSIHALASDPGFPKER